LQILIKNISPACRRYAFLLKNLKINMFIKCIPIQVEDAGCRDDLVKHLRSSGIGASVHFAPVVHEMKPYSNGKFRCGNMSNTEKVASRIVTLPMYPDMTAEDVALVVETLHDFFSA